MLENRLVPRRLLKQTCSNCQFARESLSISPVANPGQFHENPCERMTSFDRRSLRHPRCWSYRASSSRRAGPWLGPALRRPGETAHQLELDRKSDPDAYRCSLHTDQNSCHFVRCCSWEVLGAPCMSPWAELPGAGRYSLSTCELAKLPTRTRTSAGHAPR